MEQDTSQDERRSTFRFRAGALDVEASGPEGFTTKVFDEFKAVLLQRIESLSAEGVAGAQEETAGVGAGADAERSLGEFYRACAPSTEHARVTVFAYYRKRYQGVNTINQSVAEQMYNEVGEKLPKKVRNAFSDAARRERGWLKRVGKGTYEITGAGENMMRTTYAAAVG